MNPRQDGRMPEPDEMMTAVSASLHARTGRTLADWVALASATMWNSRVEAHPFP